TADLHALRHLKKVAQRITETEREQKISKLILSGPDEAAHEFYHLLPESLQRLVIKFQTLQLNALADEVLAESFRVKRESEVSDENTLVENVIEKSSYGKDPKARLGIKAVLDELRKGRVDSLVYRVSLDMNGSECRECDILFDGTSERNCPYCGSGKEPAANLIEQILVRVKRNGGRITPVDGQAAERLDSKGGVGAMLRY
ncbi:MAG: hypothetical protein KC649_00320, partial [Candidatus Omnitrophica bacterium]|nr:hypothetical protein [Candidatus Omnitrophota bacterium]